VPAWPVLKSVIETWKPEGVSLMLTASWSPGFIFSTSFFGDGGKNG
jgi:hypothetical protein